MTHRTTSFALLACAGLTLAGCGTTDGAATSAANTSSVSSASTASVAPAGTSSTSPGAATTNTSGLVVEDAWVKAVPTLDPMAMTGAFGTLRNTTQEDVTITAATQDASALTELHETVMVDGKKVMRKIRGGFAVKAGQALELRPGGSHIMLMQLTRPLPVGAEVTFTLTTASGTTLSWAAPAKQFTAPQETYAPGQDSGMSSGSPSSDAPPSTR